MVTLSFGTHKVKAGETAHLASLELKDIEYITFATRKHPGIETTLSHIASPDQLREFWMLNGDETVEWREDKSDRKGQWVGSPDSRKYFTLIVWVKP